MWRRNVPLGVLKWRTLPSSRNMLTSSTPGMGWTLSFLSAPCSFLSSCAVDGFVFRTILRRMVPLPPAQKFAYARVSARVPQIPLLPSCFSPTHRFAPLTISAALRLSLPLARAKGVDIGRGKNAPILLAAAWACSLANFAGSMVMIVVDRGSSSSSCGGFEATGSLHKRLRFVPQHDHTKSALSHARPALIAVLLLALQPSPKVRARHGLLHSSRHCRGRGMHICAVVMCGVFIESPGRDPQASTRPGVSESDLLVPSHFSSIVIGGV